MTTGQKLVELSGLASGSALAHLLAVTQGTGTGVDRIIFASQMAVSIEDDQVSVIQRPSEHNVATTQAETTTTQQDKPSRVYAQTRPARVDVATPHTSIHVVQKPATSVSVRLLPNHLTTQRKRVVKSI